jgi:hypothetical protein
MPDSPNLIPTQNSQGSANHSRSAPSWLVRLEFFLRVMVRLYVGLTLFVLPWTHFWTANRLLLYYGPIAKVAFSGITRGLVSGLGILNAWIALSEAIHQPKR